ncbi:MFS transporter [Fibrella aquatilis]|uniref:MFS transporter n=1 Tax=Fibrella aquatilis TaxID=2817059 RepID=A0A939G8B0_9BACT|nr:MFS transporter [Fibrella aquatilis]MBO0932825.1 MFS transporter [Fibrella aquatilis]
MPKNRLLLLIYLLVFIDVTVGSATGPVRPQFVRSLSNPELWLAVGTALFQGVQLVSAPLLGSLSDRFGRKPLVILSSAGTLLANLLLLPVRAWAFFANRVSDGLTNGMYSLMRSSVTDLSPKEDLAKNSGYISTLVSLGGVFGPMVSGVALAFTRDPTRQVTLVVWTIIGLSALNVALSWFMTEPSNKQTNGDKPAPPDRAAVWQAVRDNLNVALLWQRLSDKEKAHKGVRFITILTILITLHQGYLTYFITYLELGPMKLSPQQTAYFFAYFGGLSALTNFLYFRFLVDRINRRTMLIISAFVGAGLHVMYANAGSNLWLLCGAVAVDTLTISLGSGILNGLFANLTGDDDRGELVGLNQALIGVASLLTTLIYGGLSTINLSLPFYWFAASLIALGIMSFRIKT